MAVGIVLNRSNFLASGHPIGQIIEVNLLTLVHRPHNQYVHKRNNNACYDSILFYKTPAHAASRPRVHCMSSMLFAAVKIRVFADCLCGEERPSHIVHILCQLSSCFLSHPLSVYFVLVFNFTFKLAIRNMHYIE